MSVKKNPWNGTKHQNNPTGLTGNDVWPCAGSIAPAVPAFRYSFPKLWRYFQEVGFYGRLLVWNGFHLKRKMNDCLSIPLCILCVYACTVVCTCAYTVHEHVYTTHMCSPTLGWLEFGRHTLSSVPDTFSNQHRSLEWDGCLLSPSNWEKMWWLLLL